MSIPHDGQLQHALMRLIGSRRDNWIFGPGDACAHLALQFRDQLLPQDLAGPYRTSASHFANRVQFAAAHLRTAGWLEMATTSGRGVWRFTAKAEREWTTAFLDGDELLAEMMAAG